MFEIPLPLKTAERAIVVISPLKAYQRRKRNTIPANRSKVRSHLLDLRRAEVQEAKGERRTTA